MFFYALRSIVLGKYLREYRVVVASLAVPLVCLACVSDAPDYDAPSGKDSGADALPDGVSDPSPVHPSLGEIGADNGFDVMTWNLQKFPKNGAQTLDNLKQAIDAIKPDLVAVQEICDKPSLKTLAQSMPGWESVVVDAECYPGGYYNPPLGYLWNKETVNVRNTTRIFTNRSDFRVFPRTPLVLELDWKGVDFIVINVHYKALGDNVIDWGNESDDEMRRLRASERLEAYLRNNYAGRRVIVLGDFNDRIEEPEQTNVFMPFLNHPEDYLFADMALAQSMSSDDVSYPPYKSHIDHLLITSSLFAAHANEHSFVRTMPVDKAFFGSYSVYAQKVSDHRPVMMHLVGVEP